MTGIALPPEVVAECYRKACLAELEALKVGNVHAFAAGHGMEVSDFVKSADASAPQLARRYAPIGQRIRGGVEATIAAVGQNTNLGILLLCAPLAFAAEASGRLHANLDDALAGLDATDGSEAFAAIRLANPAGLGRSGRHDVRAPGPAVTLRTAMSEAADRDRIARAYVTAFDDIFHFGLRALEAARRDGLSGHWPTTAVHLAFLTAIPDSHIARKHGFEIAERVRRDAAATLSGLDLQAAPLKALLAHDTLLKQAGLNPGTSADLTVTTLFADALLSARGEAR